MLNKDLYCIKSCYHEYDKDEFYLDVYDEDENNYICIHAWWCNNAKKFRDPFIPFKLKKCLIGKIYKIVEKPINKSIQVEMNFKEYII